MTGTEHKTLQDAIAADLVSAIPVIGGISDFIRVLESETRPQKALQALDFVTEPIPLITPTNTILYLDRNKMLPIPLETIDKIFRNNKKEMWSEMTLWV